MTIVQTMGDKVVTITAKTTESNKCQKFLDIPTDRPTDRHTVGLTPLGRRKDTCENHRGERNWALETSRI